MSAPHSTRHNRRQHVASHAIAAVTHGLIQSRICAGKALAHCLRDLEICGRPRGAVRFWRLAPPGVLASCGPSLRNAPNLRKNEGRFSYERHREHCDRDHDGQRSDQQRGPEASSAAASTAKVCSRTGCRRRSMSSMRSRSEPFLISHE